MAEQHQDPLGELIVLYTRDGTFLEALTMPHLLVQPNVVVWSGRTFVLDPDPHRIPHYVEAIVWTAPPETTGTRVA